jgi:hypothetical protein
VTTRCPVCGERGSLRLFVPTGQLVVVHPGGPAPSGGRRADEACVLSERQRRLIAEALTATGADLGA